MASMYAESIRAFLKPVVPFLDDPAVSEIMINAPDDIWIEKKGKVFKTDAKFHDEEALQAAARNMAQYVGRLINDERPRLDARLPDGSRIHIVLPPIARKGTTVSIRKFFQDKLGVGKLIEFGSITPEMARFIEACVLVKENIVVSGGTGSGKTTLLNIVSTLIPNDERILTIEDSAELQLQQEHLVAFESRPPDKLGKGGVTMGDLLHSALRLRPDRIVVGEVRGGECFDLMQAMNTGHGGSMSTTHANTPTDTLRRLESLCLMSSVELPMVAVRAQVASAINVIICCERFSDGSRRVTHIAEVLPLNEKGDYRTQDIFVYTPVKKDSEGKVLGYHAPTGVLPTFLPRMHAYGFTDLTDSFFDPTEYGVPPPPIFHVEDGAKTKWAGKLKGREEGKADPDGVQKLDVKAEVPKPRVVAAWAPSGSAPAAAAPAAQAASTAPAAPAAKSASKVPDTAETPVAAKPAEASKSTRPAPPVGGSSGEVSATDIHVPPAMEPPPERPSRPKPAPRPDPSRPASSPRRADDKLDEEFERQVQEAIEAAARADEEAQRASRPPPRPPPPPTRRPGDGTPRPAPAPAGRPGTSPQGGRPLVKPTPGQPLVPEYSTIEISDDLKEEAEKLLKSSPPQQRPPPRRPPPPARPAADEDDDPEQESDRPGETTQIRPVPPRR